MPIGSVALAPKIPVSKRFFFLLSGDFFTVVDPLMSSLSPAVVCCGFTSRLCESPSSYQSLGTLNRNTPETFHRESEVKSLSRV